MPYKASKQPKAHEYASLFPLATDDELLKMAEDIKQRGLQCPIIMLDGQVLDGRNRLAACELAGIAPRFEQYSGTDPLADVVSWNLHRRHLSTSQLAELAVELKPMFSKQAKERQAEQAKKNRPQSLKVANLPHSEKVTAGIDKTKARDQVAAVVGVSGRTVQDAEFIHKHAPKLSKEIKAGKMTVHAAKQQVKEQEEKKHPSTKKAPCKGLKYARLAISNLKQIKENDEKRREAFVLVREWLDKYI
jgi:oligoribonuclease (3'-5' exoribonuclease)